MAKIMLVEDDNNLREIYEARLLAEGYQIISAKDGEEALAVAVKERPDLIISDVMMPKISGFDMLDILRTTPETKDVKVIMMTALSQAEDKGRADKLGADRYLVKSQVTLEDVAQVAREVLGGQAAAPAAAPAPAPATPAPAAAPAAPAPAMPVAAAPAEPASTPAPAPAPAPEPTPAPATPTSIPVSTPDEDTVAPATPAADPTPAPEPATPAADMPAPTPPSTDEPADTTTGSDAPTNEVSQTADQLADTVNNIINPAGDSQAADESTAHGKVLQPISEPTTAPPAPEAPAAETNTPEPTPPAEPSTPAPEATPATETPAPAEPTNDTSEEATPAPQPGNVIQPGVDPNQIAL